MKLASLHIPLHMGGQSFTLTDSPHPTHPDPVRRALGLRKHDRIAWREDNGRVYLERASDKAEPDPALAPFLALLSKDMADNPAILRSLVRALEDRLTRLTQGADVDLNAPLPPETP